MKKINTSYQVSLSDFRRATYFGMFQLYRRPLQIMVVVLLVGALYCFGAYLGLGQLNPLVLFITVAYLIWGIMMLSRTERGIRRYLGTKDCLVGCTYEVELESNRIRFEVPERDISFSTQVNKLACVFETSSAFMIYINMQDAHILPHHALTPQQRADLRANFRKHLDGNFSTRFS